ncbi:hypothetical protein M3936_15515 [Sutcliffiella horikoshii]|uniref:hypothetical protein n=1 Tax=Sutcliffiella horikoshii TaxID=79883 RepID=UPI0007D07309|nr:hypothetical protein [Sutcliffiella horikoshii]MCM3618996.1 hypothetical protein [Sutcliffiella horikoshii]
MKEQHNQDKELYQLEDEMKDTFTSYVVKTPSSQDTKALLAALQPAFDEIGKEPAEEPVHEMIKAPSFLSQLKAQVSFYQWHFWIASTLIFVMLTLFSSTYLLNDAILIYQFAIPLSMLVGVFYTYQTWNKQMRTIEGITPFPPALLLLSRMVIILIMNIIMGIVSSIYLSFSMDHFKLLPFLLHWIAPALLIYGIIAYVMMQKGVKKGLALGMACWIGLMMAAFVYQASPGTFIQLTYTKVAGIQGAFVIIGALLLFLSYKKSLELQTMFR